MGEEAGTFCRWVCRGRRKDVGEEFKLQNRRSKSDCWGSNAWLRAYLVDQRRY